MSGVTGKSPPELPVDLVQKDYLPFHQPSLGQEEERAVMAVLRSRWLTRGQRTAEFESMFAEFAGARYALALNSCTAAMHLALLTSDVGPGDEVITTPFTFAATANTVIHAGATPVFADIDPETMNINPGLIQKALTGCTKALMPVHFGGRPCDMEAIGGLAAEHGLVVIEDAAHALGARYRDRMVGSISPLTAFSFYATKNITTGEGGMLTTDDPELERRARVLSLHGMSADAWNRYGRRGHRYYEVMEPGFKYNMFDLQAALGIEQLKRADAMQESRRRLARAYDEELADFPLLDLPAPADDDTDHAHHLYIVRLELGLLGVTRDEVAAMMEQLNIGVSVHFRALHLHPYYRDRFGLRPEDYPVATAMSERTLSLPLYPAMSDDDARRVAGTLKAVLEHGKL
jgi:dTDP-4-amino-4,6-dideoxygalactose transaminase